MFSNSAKSNLSLAWSKIGSTKSTFKEKKYFRELKLKNNSGGTSQAGGREREGVQPAEVPESQRIKNPYK